MQIIRDLIRARERAQYTEQLEKGYKELDAVYEDTRKRLRATEVDFERLQKGVAHFISVAVAVDVLRTTPKLERAFLELCDEYKISNEP